MFRVLSWISKNQCMYSSKPLIHLSIVRKNENVGNLSEQFNNIAYGLNLYQVPMKSHRPGTTSIITFLNTSVIAVTTQVRWKKWVNPYPPLNEDELEEQFITGSGPGGQSINKTANCVMLKHKPTSVVVKCQETRSLDDNRKRARILLQEKLDWYFNRDKSIKELQKRESSKNKAERKKKTKLKLEKLKAFKEREGLN